MNLRQFHVYQVNYLIASRFTHAGDADDCGHERPGDKGGKFTEGNTCATGGKESRDTEIPFHEQVTGRKLSNSKKDVELYKDISNVRDYIEGNSYLVMDEVSKKLLKNKNYAIKINEVLKMFDKNSLVMEELMSRKYGQKNLDELKGHISSGMNIQETDNSKNKFETDGYSNYFIKASSESDNNIDINKNLRKVHNSSKFTSHLYNFNVYQKEALKDYSGGDYQDMNDYLRKGSQISSDMKNKIDRLHDALLGAKLPNDIIVYRGIGNLNDIYEKFDKNDPESMIGSIIKDNGFMSTSLDMNKAATFSGRGAIFEMKASKGSNAVTTNKITDKNSDECEFVFDYGYSIEITGWRKDDVSGSERVIFECKIINK